MQTAPQDPPQQQQNVSYFYAVDHRKFIALWLGTLGFYGLYWFYQHWQTIRTRTGEDFKPWQRTLLAGSWCEPLLLQFQDAGHGFVDAPNLKPRLRAIAWLLLTATLLLGPPLSLLCPWAFLPLVAAQRRANQVNAARTPDAAANSRFTARNALAMLPLLSVLVLGALVLTGHATLPNSY